MIRSAEQIAAARKVKAKETAGKTSITNHPDTEKPATNKVERKRVGGKTSEQVPRRVSLCTPCALFIPVNVSEIIFLHV